jgi:hypothetical protein
MFMLFLWKGFLLDWYYIRRKVNDTASPAPTNSAAVEAVKKQR